MARKLKSDKLLFTATLVLVCASLVMVYSSSAVIGLEQYTRRPTCSSSSRRRSRCSGLALMPLLMRVDYRHYRQPLVIWTALGMTGRRAGRRCCSGRGSTARGAGSASPGSACSRRSSPRSSSSSSSPRFSSGAWIASTICATRCVPVGVVLGGVVGLIMLQPDLGTALSIIVIVVGDGLRRRDQLSLHHRPAARVAAGRVRSC